jgi:hypothetical protein
VSARVTGTLVVKGQHSLRHRFRGAPVPSTGVSLLQVSPGVRFRLSPALVLYGTAQAPAYVRANESQLGPRLTVTAGFVKAF